MNLLFGFGDVGEFVYRENFNLCGYDVLLC